VKILTYDSFGSVVSDSNPSLELPIGYAGGLSDPVTGLVRFGLRDYDPDAGRWTARDPVFFDAPAVNLYAYTDNDPVAFGDPSGLDWSWEGFKSSASQAVGQAVEWGKTNAGKIAEFVADQASKFSDKVKLGKETWDKGKKVVDTANDVEDTIITVEENMNTPQNGNESGNQGANLLRCGLKWLKKAPLPFDWITEPATATLDQAVKVGNEVHEAGTGFGGSNNETIKALRAEGGW
jgi:RHS repeat-associated protein